MKVSLRLPVVLSGTRDTTISAAELTGIAQAAEAAGFDGVFLTDHPAPSQDFDTHGGHHDFDPFALLSFIAAGTDALRLITSLIVLSYRNPFLTAKAAATLDVLSGGRTVLGVGAGYLRPEFAALGVDFAERNDLTDEAIDVMKAIWTGQPVTHAGLHFTADANLSYPVPVQKPGPPIWVGGNSRRAIRRAVERGAGWSPFPVSSQRSAVNSTVAMDGGDALRDGLDYADAHRRTVGRTAPLDVIYVASPPGGGTGTADPDGYLADARRLADLGVTYLLTQLPMPTVAALHDEIAGWAAHIIPELETVRPVPRGA